MRDPESELRDGASPRFQKAVPWLMIFLRYAIPPLIAVVLLFSLRDTVELLFG